MADFEDEVTKLFAGSSDSIPEDVMTELLHIIKLMSLSPEDLYYKWDSYVITMGAETTKLDYRTVRDFKKTLQDALDRESKKGQVIHNAAKRIGSTPRAASSGGHDVFGLLDGMVSSPNVQRTSAAKRKPINFDSPLPKSAKSGLNSSPKEGRTGAPNISTVAFEDRPNAGDVLECLNPHLESASCPAVPPSEARIKLKAAVDLPKFSYKPMAMKLSEASEVLDDRIDSFCEAVQKHYQLPDHAFGNPAAQSTSEVVAVGRIACDTPNSKLNAASLVLETSRRMGAGMRVLLRMGDTKFDFFPGKIVALKGTNVSGEFFSVNEVLQMPLLPQAASRIADLEAHVDRLRDQNGQTTPLSLIIASGPFTNESDLSFAPLYSLLEKATMERADALILSGPFLDLEHPAVASGDFEPYLPHDVKIEPDRANTTDIFRILIGQPLSRLAQAVPNITIVLIPSVRDAISKHVSWPQDRVPKAALGLPKQVNFVTNPMTLFMNEMVVGMSSQDVLSELRHENVHQLGKSQSLGDDLLGRLAGHLIEQSHFFPVYPPQAREELLKPAVIAGEIPEPGGENRFALGANLDLSYLKLGEFWTVRPDILIIPSVLNPFVKVVDSVICINPGTLSKRRAPGTFVMMSVHPRELSDQDRESNEVGHDVYNRAKLEIIRV